MLATSRSLLSSYNNIACYIDVSRFGFDLRFRVSVTRIRTREREVKSDGKRRMSVCYWEQQSHRTVYLHMVCSSLGRRELPILVTGTNCEICSNWVSKLIWRLVRQMGKLHLLSLCSTHYELILLWHIISKRLGALSSVDPAALMCKVAQTTL